MIADPSLDGRLGRKKKTPQEMAAESAAAEEAAGKCDDEETGMNVIVSWLEVV